MSAGTRYPTEWLAMLVDGEWLGAEGRETRPVIDPATGAELGDLPRASTEDLDRALDAAARAFRSWREVPPAERAAILHRAADLMRERVDEIALAMTLEQGKPLHESRGEVEYSAEIIDFLAGEGLRAYGTVVPTGSYDRRAYELAEPVGPVASFAPWNYPVTVPSRKIAAALAAGCTVVLKLSEETPACGLGVARAFVDAGVPAGVLNVVFGQPSTVSRHLITSPLTRIVSFTGSTPVGRTIASLAGEHVKPCKLELGGHAPLIVDRDVDVDVVAEAAVRSKFHNGGQSCGAPSRFYLHESLHDAFVDRFAELMASVRVGNGLEDVDMGPMANSRRVESLRGLVEDAVAHGARLVAGGEPIEGDGYFFPPTLLSRVPEDALIMNEEPFGPVVATSSFTDLEEVVERANRLPFGLGAYLFSGSVDVTTWVPRALEAGLIGVNEFNLGGPSTYFGGVKDSGYGSEGGPEAVRGYLVPKLINQGPVGTRGPRRAEA